MTVDAFGYEALTLRELLQQLSSIADDPRLAIQPVWQKGEGGLYCPVYRVDVITSFSPPRIHLGARP